MMFHKYFTTDSTSLAFPENHVPSKTIGDVMKWLRNDHQLSPKIFMTDCCKSLKAAISDTYKDMSNPPKIVWCFWHVLRAVRAHAKTVVSFGSVFFVSKGNEGICEV